MNAKKMTVLASSAAAVVGSVAPAFAQERPSVNISREEAGLRIADVGQLISGAVGAALLISALMVFGYLILGGIQWITSGGDKGKTESARNKITASLVGLAIVASSFAIMQLINFFFGINIFGSGIVDTLDQIKPY